MKEETTITVYSLFLFFYSVAEDADAEATCSVVTTAVQALSGYLFYSAAVDVAMAHYSAVTETVAVAAAS